MKGCFCNEIRPVQRSFFGLYVFRNEASIALFRCFSLDSVMRLSCFAAPLLGWLFALSAFAGDAGIRPGAEALRNWPQWRGPLAHGVAPLGNPPIHWSETNNVR